MDPENESSIDGNFEEGEGEGHNTKIKDSIEKNSSCENFTNNNKLDSDENFL